MIGLFLVPGEGLLSSLAAAGLLTGAVLLGIAATLGVSRLLSATLLRGVPSAFALELPPYRRPQVGRILVRSVLDRTLFVLGRAAAVAAPAGLLLWLLARIPLGEGSLLAGCAGALDPLGRLMGMDGAILLAFVLGFPANEIVLPIALMIYLSSGTLPDAGDTAQLRQLLLANGWTPATAVSVMLFSLFHWPCSTTCLTIRRETGSLRWALLGAAVPTVLGAGLCVLLTAALRLLGLA